MADWYLKETDGTAGPFAFEVLRQLATLGRLKPSDRVRQEGQHEWRSAHEVAELFPETAFSSKPFAPLEFRAVEVGDPSGASYWLLAGGVPKGPYLGEQLRQWLDLRTLPADARVCKTGTSEWISLGQVLGRTATNDLARSSPGEAAIASLPSSHFGSREAADLPPNIALPRVSAGPAAAAASRSDDPRDRSSIEPAWHPLAIALLGVLFSPLWTGAMTALNSQRLALKSPPWKPFGIAAAAFAIDLVLHRMSGPWWVSLGLYFGALLAIWSTDLSEQWTVYSQARQAGAKAAGWGMPVLAAFVLIGVCIAGSDYLYPPGPRDICERFASASDISSRKETCTEKFWTALAPLGLNSPMEFELLDDTPAKAPHVGHLVGFRHYFLEQGQILVMEGSFFLVRSGETWKVEEILVNHDGHTPLGRAVPFTAMLGANADMRPADPFTPHANLPVKQAAAAVPPAKPGARRPWAEAHLVGLLLSKTKIPAAIVAVLAGLYACFRRPTDAKTPSA